MTRRQGWVALAVAMAASGALLLWMQRDLTFVSDEIAWIEWAGTEPLSSLLSPYNGNLIVSTLLVTRGLLSSLGTAYLWFGLVQVVGLWLCAGSLYALASRRIGNAPALAPAAAMLFLGSGWAVLLQPLIGTVFVYSLGLGLCGILALERRDRRGDITACVLFCAALSFYSVGLAFLAGAAVAIALSPGRWRRAWVVAAPAGLYVAWRITAHFIESPFFLGGTLGEPVNIIRAPLYLIDSVALVAGAIFAGGIDSLSPGPATGLVLDGFSLGRLAGAAALLGAEIAAVALAAVWVRRRGPIPRSVWVALVMLLTLWAAQSYVLGPGRTAAESRYLFSGAFMMLVVLVEVTAAARPPQWVTALAAALFVVPIYLNLQALHDPHQLLQDYSTRDRADMAMIELADGRVEPSFRPLWALDPVPPALYLTAGPWNRMAAKLGSPSMSLSDLRRQPEAVREEADTVLASALRLGARPASAALHRCRTSADRGVVVLTPPGVIVRTGKRGAGLFVGRFAERLGTGVGILPPHSTSRLRVPADRVNTPWRLRAAPPAGLCPLRR